MRPITADLRPERAVPPVLWWFTGLMVVCAVVTSWMAYAAEQEVVSLEARLRAQRETQARADEAAVQAPVPYERSAREMLAEYHRPWPEALTALEATEVAGITLTALESPSGEAVMRVELIAVDHGVLLEYLNALNAGRTGVPGELSWRLVSTRKAESDGGTAATILGEVRVGRP